MAGGGLSDAEVDALDTSVVCAALARGAPVGLPGDDGTTEATEVSDTTPSEDAETNPFLSGTEDTATNPFFSRVVEPGISGAYRPEAPSSAVNVIAAEADTNPFLEGAVPTAGSHPPGGSLSAAGAETSPFLERAVPAAGSQPPGGSPSATEAETSPFRSSTESDLSPGSLRCSASFGSAGSGAHSLDAMGTGADESPPLTAIPEEDLRLLALQMYVASSGASDEPHVDLLASQLDVAGAFLEGARAVLGQAGVCSGGLFSPGWDAVRAVSGDSLLQVFLELSQCPDEPLPEHLSRLREVAARGIWWILEEASREEQRDSSSGGSGLSFASARKSPAALALSRARDFLQEPGGVRLAEGLAAALGALGLGQLELSWAQKVTLYEALLPATFDLLEENTLSDDFDDIVSDLRGVWLSFGIDQILHEAALVRTLLHRYSQHEEEGDELLSASLEKVDVLWRGTGQSEDGANSESDGSAGVSGSGSEEDEEDRLLREAVETAESGHKLRDAGRQVFSGLRSTSSSKTESRTSSGSSRTSKSSPKSLCSSPDEGTACANNPLKVAYVQRTRKLGQEVALRSCERLGAARDGGLAILKLALSLGKAGSNDKAHLQACGRAYLKARAEALAPIPGPSEKAKEETLCAKIALLRTVLDEAVLLASDFYQGESYGEPTISLSLQECGNRILSGYPRLFEPGSPEATVDRSTVNLVREVTSFEIDLREHASTVGISGSALEAISMQAFWEALQVKLYSWASLQVETLECTCKRIVEIEDWKVTPPGTAAPANSAIDLLRLTSSFLDNGLELGAGMPISFIHIITQSVSSTVQIYCESVAAGLCPRGMSLGEMFAPPVPQLMRFKEKQHLQMCDEHNSWVAQPWELGEAQRAALEADCAKVNSLWHVQEKLATMEVSVKERWRDLRGESNTVTLDSLDFFDEAYRALERQREWLAAYSAARHVFMDMKRPFLTDLYFVSVRKCRISHVLGGLEQYLQAAAESSLTDGLRDLFARELLKAALSALEIVLLDGGNFRVFDLKDSLMLERDLAKLQDLFFADGEGLDMGDIEELSQSVSSILTLVSVDTEAIVENFKELHVRCCIVTEDWDGNRDPRKKLTEDPATFLRILCHRGDRSATKFLKDAFPQLETMVADEKKIGRQRFQTMKNVVRRKVSQILEKEDVGGVQA